MKYTLAFLLLFVASSVSADVVSVQSNITMREPTVEENIRAVFWNAPVMVEIARCESGFRQFDSKGSVLKGRVNSKDKGAYQINEKYHLDTANQLGYNIYITSGNIRMAKYIYEHQGTKPWEASKSCWSKASNVV